MNRTVLVLGFVVAGLLTFALFFRGQPVVGQVEKKEDAKPEKRVLTTTGSATIRVKPDAARVFLTIETTAPTVAEARARNNESSKKVLDAVQALQIANLKMKSVSVNMSIIHSEEEKKATLPRILGYRVTNSFTVLVTSGDPVKLAGYASQVLDTALEKGANNVDRIVFFKQDLAEAQREALTKATEDALANARALLEGAGRILTDVTSINGDPTYHEREPLRFNSPYSLLPMGGDGATPLVAGEIEVTCRVSVTCTYGAGKN